MSDWKTICAVTDIPVLGARRVERARGMAVAVFRNSEDKVFALLDRCPHKGGPLSQGIVFGESVACPLHNWSIGLADGCAKSPDEGCTVPFAVTVKQAWFSSTAPSWPRWRSICWHRSPAPAHRPGRWATPPSTCRRRTRREYGFGGIGPSDA